MQRQKLRYKPKTIHTNHTSTVKLRTRSLLLCLFPPTTYDSKHRNSGDFLFFFYQHRNKNTTTTLHNTQHHSHVAYLHNVRALLPTSILVLAGDAPHHHRYYTRPGSPRDRQEQLLGNAVAARQLQLHQQRVVGLDPADVVVVIIPRPVAPW